ncbi:MAG: aldehyde dehydrogenase family protein [Rhizomicrobium sp.]
MSAEPADRIVVANPYDGTLLAELPSASPADVDDAVASAQEAAEVSAGLSRAARGEILDRTAWLLEEEAEGAARLIVREAGKTIRQARKEVRRAVNTLHLSAAEARRLAGEVVPFDSFSGNEGRIGYFTYEPLGLIAGITPYNDPLNLVAHKVGPAIAGGNAILLKPSELAPLSAIRLAKLFAAAGLPPDIFSILTGGPLAASRLAGAPAVRMVSFTGGMAAAAKIVQAGGVKRYAMDLGGNAPVMVMADCDLEKAVENSVSGAFWAAGQNCVGVQRIFVEQSIASRFVDAFVARTRALMVGDPLDEATDMGPMISAAHAARAMELVGDAVRRGARLLAGGSARGALMTPTVLLDTPHAASAWRDEAFGPMVSIESVPDIDAALALANACDASLHAAIFTTDLNRALTATKSLQASGVMINDSSDFRLDAMPFGGFKQGSMGREGVRFALSEMTQSKVVMFGP